MYLCVFCEVPGVQCICVLKYLYLSQLCRPVEMEGDSLKISSAVSLAVPGSTL